MHEEESWQRSRELESEHVLSEFALNRNGLVRRRRLTYAARLGVHCPIQEHVEVLDSNRKESVCVVTGGITSERGGEIWWGSERGTVGWGRWRNSSARRWRQEEEGSVVCLLDRGDRRPPPSSSCPKCWIAEIYDFREVGNLISLFPFTKQKRRASYVRGRIGVRNHLCRIHLSAGLAVSQRDAILPPSGRCTRDESERTSCVEEAHRGTCRLQVWSQLIAGAGEDALDFSYNQPGGASLPSLIWPF